MARSCHSTATAKRSFDNGDLELAFLRYIQDAAVTVSTAPITINDFGGFPRKPASVQEFLLSGQNT
jgi:hypothetical protein